MGQPCAPERVLHLIRQKRTVACRHCRGCSRIRLCQNFAQRHAQRRLHPFSPSPKRTALPLWQKAVQIFSRQKNAVCVIAVCIIVFFQFRELHARRESIRPAKPAAEKENTPEKGAQPCRSLRPQEHRPERYLQESPATFPQPLRGSPPVFRRAPEWEPSSM